MSRSFAIVGAGKVGSALARLLSEHGYEFLGAASRSTESAEAACEFAGAGTPHTAVAPLTRRAGLVFLTVPDDAIEQVCSQIARDKGFAEGAVVAHCSGALDSTTLAPAAEAGAHVGSMHPLQSFATAEQALSILPGSCCCIEGDHDAVDALRDVAHAAACRPMTLSSEGKPLSPAASTVALYLLHI